MNCTGCGVNMGELRLPITEFWQEFCGKCNESYYKWVEEQEKFIEIEILADQEY